MHHRISGIASAVVAALLLTTLAGCSDGDETRVKENKELEAPPSDGASTP